MAWLIEEHLQPAVPPAHIVHSLEWRCYVLLMMIRPDVYRLASILLRRAGRGLRQPLVEDAAEVHCRVSKGGPPLPTCCAALMPLSTASLLD